MDLPIPAGAVCYMLGWGRFVTREVVMVKACGVAVVCVVLLGVAPAQAATPDEATLARYGAATGDCA